MGSKKTKRERSTNLKIHDKELPIVNTTTHLGIQRSSTVKDTIMDTINKNITKARRTCYSLLPAGLHGNNGLDPVTSLHLIKTFVIPTLLYSLEIVLPSNTHLTVV